MFGFKRELYQSFSNITLEQSERVIKMIPRHEILFNQLESYRGIILEAIESVTEEQANRVPDGFKNNIRWNLGHIYIDQYLWIYALTKESSEEIKRLNTWFGYGTSPSNFEEGTPTLEELRELLSRQPHDIKNSYGNRLEEEFAPTEMGMYTIEQVLSRTIFHEGLHLQAILDLKKFIS